MIFLSLIFPISPRRKRKPIMFGIENAMQRGIRKIFTFVKLLIVAKVFGKITQKPYGL